VLRAGSPLVSRWTIVAGQRMHARVGGARRLPADLPVILVHGLGVSSRYMGPTADRLAPFYRVYAPDLPGFGRSARPRQALDVPGLADALHAWLRANRLERAAFLGNSMGCQVIVDLAARYPAVVARIILVAPTIDRRARHPLVQIGRALWDMRGERLSLVPIVTRDYLAAGLIRDAVTFHYALQDRIEDKLPRVRVPALVIRGARDPIVPPRWAQEVTGLLPAGRLVVLPGAPHAANYSRAPQLVATILPFLREPPGAPAP